MHYVKTAIKKLTDTLEKHMHHFQCQQSEFKMQKKSAQYKWSELAM